MPPLSVIMDWVRRKGIGLRAGPKQRGRGFKRRTDSELRGIAFVIARRIKARGLPAHHILQLAGEKLARVVGEELGKSLGQGAESRE